MHIILIGLRGSGKSTVGYKLADEMWREFIDLDVATLARFAEATITDVFETHGESVWRAAEVEALREVLERSELVISLGGGTAMIPEAREMLRERQKEHGDRIVYLRASAKTLEERLAAELGDRPSLTGFGTLAEIKAIRDQRDPVYHELADQTIDVDQIDVAAIMAHVFRLVR